MYKHILVPTDGTRLSDKAIQSAAELAAKIGAKLTGLHVLPPYNLAISGYEIAPVVAFSPAEYRQATAKSAKAALDKVENAASEAGVNCASLSVTNELAWDAIVRAAHERKCDLIVMASHGRRGLSGLILGSETTKVLTHSKVPVLVVR
jgi:nucleotide-binding universal stress UspA family protein